MKFTDGFWRNRPGVNIYNAAKVYDYEIQTSSLTVFAPYFNVKKRDETLWGPLLTIRLTSPLSDIIRVQVWHYMGQSPKGPDFKLEATTPSQVEIYDRADALIFKSGSLEARFAKGDTWDLSFFCNNQPLTNSQGKNLGYVLDKEGKPFMKEQLALGVGQTVYGLGERFTSFVKNGQVVESWNADGGTSSELAYKAIPFYICSQGYGVFVNHPGPVSFEVASEKVSRVQFSVPGEYLDYYLIAGPDPKKVLQRYTALTGRPALPPAWSFGLWLTTSFVTDYNEETVSSFIDGMAERDIPLSVFHFDCFWMKEYNWSNLEWDLTQFPEPEVFLAKLKKRGLKICVWINPYIAQRSALFSEGAEHGYLLKTVEGNVWQTDTWQPGMGIVDFTNPDACRWFSAKLECLLAMGVDCFKTDFGEAIPVDNVAWHDGSDPFRMHNYYTYLYNETVFGLLERKKGKGEAVVFARSATAGSQRFPVHWGGDSTANYDSMAETLRGGLSLCTSGFGFWSHDISGFERTATPDLYKRWTAFGLLSTHSRLHGNASYRVPWLFDEEAVEVLRFFTKLKCRLMPYLFAAACTASTTGVPVMRPMFLEFPDDPACAYLDRQYLLGAGLLVAPVFRADGEVAYYLPEGEWTHFITGSVVTGGRWLREQYGYMSLPVFVRSNSLLAIGNNDRQTDYNFAQDVELSLYALSDNREAHAIVCNSGGDTELEVTVKRSGKVITVASNGTKPWAMRLMNIAQISSVKHARCETGATGTLIHPDHNSGSFEIILI